METTITITIGRAKVEAVFVFDRDGDFEACYITDASGGYHIYEPSDCDIARAEEALQSELYWRDADQYV